MIAAVRPVLWVVAGASSLVGLMAVAFAHQAQASNTSTLPPKPKPKPKPTVKPAAKPTPATPAAKPKPPPSAAKAEVVSKIPIHAIDVTPAPAPKPAAKPAPQPAVVSARSTKQAAEDLYTLAASLVRSNRGDELGTSLHPNEKVRAAQTDMRGNLKADGVYGPKTMARGKELLGKPFPNRNSTVKALPAPAPKPTAAAPKPAPKPTDKTNAAKALDFYLMDGGRAKATIADQQWTLGLDADGDPGPKTRAAVQSALGRALDWPSSITATGAEPAGATAEAAAQRLVRYYRDNAGRRKDRIAAYQTAMGVEPAGSVGPLTKAKVKALTGVSL
jgi:hypothetical protein